MATNSDVRSVSLPTDDEMVDFDDITQVDQEPNTAGAKAERAGTSLWLLTRKPTGKQQGTAPNEAFVMVVEAPDEQQARQQAASDSGGAEQSAWTDAAAASCRKLELTGETRVVASEPMRG